MKKSKIILLFKIIIIILTLINIISFYIFNNNYNKRNLIIKNEGLITNITYYDDYIILYIKSNINIKAYYYDVSQKYCVGDKISFTYENKDVQSSGIFNTFNYKDYLKSQNIKKVINITSLKKTGENILYKLKNYFLNLSNKRKSKSYINTFLFANKTDLDMNVKNSYQHNGISHLLCVSGFHVIFLLSIFKSFLRLIIKKEKITMFLLMIISFVYLLNSNFSIPLLRAFMFYFFGYYNKRFSLNLSNIIIFLLTLNTCLLFGINVIYSLSFWYTFTLSFFLMNYQINNNNNFKILKFIRTIIYAYTISLPLTIYFNYSINFLSIIYNIFFSVIVCYVIYPLCFLALFSSFFDSILLKIIILFENINLKLGNVNLLCLFFRSASIYVIIILYLTIFLYIYKRKFIFLICYFLIIIMLYFSVYIDNSNYVYYLNVGQGDMSVIITSNHKSITVIDTGCNYFKYDYLFNNIVIFLHSVGVNKISNLIITHGDFDHMGEAINLVNNFKVEKVIFNCGEFNDLEKELIKVLDRKKIKYYLCVEKIKIDNNKLYFLQTKKYDNENDNSNVIYTELNGYKFLFMGDASITTEEEIMKNYNLLDIDVLKVGHHGSKTSSSREFIDEINPKYSIISVGKNNRYGHPNKEVLENLENSKIYRTDQDGSIMFKIKNNKLKIDTCSP